MSPNINTHIESVPKAVDLLKNQGVNARYQVLMADTECDLLPFLHKIALTPEEFIGRCQGTVNKINTMGISAQRFLEYFGADKFYEKYNDTFNKLQVLYQSNQKEQAKINANYRLRKPLIQTLIGSVNDDEGIRHLLRQQAQYITYAALLRQQFEGRLIAVNHQTPNFVAMNHGLARVRTETDFDKGHFLPILPLVELSISTLPL